MISLGIQSHSIQMSNQRQHNTTRDRQANTIAYMHSTAANKQQSSSTNTYQSAVMSPALNTTSLSWNCSASPSSTNSSASYLTTSSSSIPSTEENFGKLSPNSTDQYGQGPPTAGLDLDEDLTYYSNWLSDLANGVDSVDCDDLISEVVNVDGDSVETDSHSRLILSSVGDNVKSQLDLDSACNSNHLQELSHELSNVDNSWMGLNFSEMDRIMSDVDLFSLPGCSNDVRIHDRLSTTNDIIEQWPSKQIDCSSQSMPSSSLTSHSPPTLDSADKQCVDRIVDDGSENDGFCSDETLTCSETEYQMEKIRSRRKRMYRRKRKFQPSTKNLSYCFNYTSSSSSDCTSDSDNEISLTDDQSSIRIPSQPQSTFGYHRFKNNLLLRQAEQVESSSMDNSQSSSAKRNRTQHSRCDSGELVGDDLKPWWPKRKPRFKVVLHLGQQTATNSTTAATENAPTDASNASSTIKRRRHKPCRRQSQPISSTSTTVVANHSSSSSSTNNVEVPMDDFRPVEGRRRKQLELWQFILGRLELVKRSAFEWVDRSSGVFRIVDTQLAAHEWGQYRGNKRMDYEKMARAMRFYYKDSILRKARQQLHFQFSMPYVEWARTLCSKL